MSTVVRRFAVVMNSVTALTANPDVGQTQFQTFKDNRGQKGEKVEK